VVSRGKNLCLSWLFQWSLIGRGAKSLFLSFSNKLIHPHKFIEITISQLQKKVCSNLCDRSFDDFILGSYFLETRRGYPFFPNLSFESSHQYDFFHCFLCDLGQPTAQKIIVIYFLCSTNWYRNTKQPFSPPISLNILIKY
jgi:hypothetical protein